ncbi:MAG: replicative helicase [Actinomycetota bacterium]|jgi:hypothetical protein|nr:replicative helicase [Actinomycetota bacterium]
MDLAVIVPRLSDSFSMQRLVAARINGKLFADAELGEMVDYSIAWWMQSIAEHNDGTPTPVPEAQLRDQFPGWFAQRTIPEGDYITEEIVREAREKYLRREAEGVLKGLATVLEEDPEAAVRSAIGSLVDIRSATIGTERERIFGEEFWPIYEAHIDAVLESADATSHPGIPLGFPEITDHIYGLQPGELAVFAAWTGLGKSVLMAQIALHAALQGHRVYFPSLENSLELTEMRLLCLLTGLPFAGIERGTLSFEQFERLGAAEKQMEAIGDRLVIDRPHREERTVAELYTRAAYHRADLLVGDQLTFVTPPGNSQRWQDFEDIANAIADIGQQIGIASVWAHQFVGEVGRSSSKAGGSHQLAGSQHIVRTADFVFRMSQSPEQEEDDAMEISLIKQRRVRQTGWILDWVLDGETRLTVDRETDGMELVGESS